jgi:ribonuclease VapC
MIVDSSAIMAIVLNEPERARFVHLLAGAVAPRISAGNWIELSAVLTRRRDAIADAAFAVVSQSIALTIEPVSADQARIGWDAYRRYGIGTGHPARLNFGDCFAYALARATGKPLLFKGDDFTHTDLVAAA